MYVLITANRNYSSWSLRPWMLMKGLAIPFVGQIEPFTNPVNYDEFRSFSPTGQVPALLDEGRTVYDSLGITLYLADRHEGQRLDEHKSDIQSLMRTSFASLCSKKTYIT